MNNKDIRLLTDIIKQIHTVKKEQTISELLLLELGIVVLPSRIKRIPSPKQTLFKEVITSTNGRPKLIKVLKYRSNVQK